ncbi:MAG TPA: hypothetical protein PLW86_17575 [Rhodocyclaceae bacterium]|nr:hypothetical protein [Rhodocyclaceae bacterium]
MATWKKVLLWVTGIVVVTIGGSMVALDHLFSGMCATTVFDEIPSPSKKLKAVVFQVDCGANTGFNTQVAVVKASFDTADVGALPKAVFVADKNHGRAPAGITQGPEIRLAWKSDEMLYLQHHQFARIFRSEEKQSGVTIKYEIFQ